MSLRPLVTSAALRLVANRRYASKYFSVEFPLIVRYGHPYRRRPGKWCLRAENKLQAILLDAKQEALYGLADFDDAQRLE